MSYILKAYHERITEMMCVAGCDFLCILTFFFGGGGPGLMDRSP